MTPKIEYYVPTARQQAFIDSAAKIKIDGMTINQLVDEANKLVWPVKILLDSGAHNINHADDLLKIISDKLGRVAWFLNGDDMADLEAQTTFL